MRQGIGRTASSARTTRRRIGAALLATALAIGGGIVAAVSPAAPAAAADAVDRVVDPPTYHQYPGSDTS